MSLSRWTLAPESGQPEYRAGDRVHLAEGPYQGTCGIFVRLRPDANWAEVQERGGVIRRHPIIWLRHSALGDSSTAVAA